MDKALQVELLERRQLLAVDLVVELHGLPEAVVAGQELSFEIQVSNLGDETAGSAAIASRIPSLVDLSWERSDDFDAEVALRQLNGHDGFTIGGVSGQRDAQMVGDINGDGTDDLLVGLQTYRTANQEAENVIVLLFGGPRLGTRGYVRDLDALHGNDSIVIRDAITLAEARAGDLNGDGFDDLLLSTGANNPPLLVFGRSDWSDAADQALADLVGKTRIEGRAVRAITRGGDVSGDGLGDLVILDSGSRGYVVFGRQDLGEHTNIQLSDTGMSQRVVEGIKFFGEVGDMDADGFDDVVAIRQDGIARLLLGNANLTGVEQQLSVLLGDAEHVSAVGDLNDDGHDDIVVDRSNGRTPLLVFGQSLLGAEQRFRAVEISGEFGRSSNVNFTRAGDLNDDGIDDLLAAASDFDRSNAYVVFGGDHFDSDDPLDIASLANGRDGLVTRKPVSRTDGLQGLFLSGAGDVNGDHVDDLVVGGAAYWGESHVIFGRERVFGDGSPRDFVDLPAGGATRYTVTGTMAPNARELSVTASAALCLDAPHLPVADVDLEIVRPDRQRPQSEVQYEIRVSNREETTITAAVTSPVSHWLAEPRWERTIGFPAIQELAVVSDKDIPLSVGADEVRGVGDVNGDGFSDLALSQNWFDQQVTDHYLQLGGGVGTISLGTGVPPSEMSSAGDFNDDGFDDLFVNRAGQNYKTIGILFGGETVDFEPDVTVSVDSLFNIDNAVVMARMGGVGDFNGDGVDDFVANIFIDGGPREMLAAVVFGGGEVEEIRLGQLTGADGFVIDGTYRRRWEAHMVGDMNGDGLADVVVRDAEASYLILGRQDFGRGRVREAELQSAADVRLPGWVTGPLGDVNGDGIHDLFVSKSTSFRDHAYLFFGGPQLEERDKFNLEDLDGDHGAAVLSDGPLVAHPMGDINHDGLDDFLVDPIGDAQSNPAFVVLGGRSLGRTAELDLLALDGSNGFTLLSSNSPRSTRPFPRVVSAGDVNGDLVDDVVLGRVIRFGRDRWASGDQDLVEHQIELEPGATATITVTGALRRGTTGFTASVTASTCVAQHELDPESNVITKTVPVRASLEGDVDLDGQVSFRDFLIVATNFHRDGNVSRADGDLDGDGRVGFSDFIRLSRDFGKVL